MKNRIILDKETGCVKNVIFDNADLVQSGVVFKINMAAVDSKMMLGISCELNDKFEIIFE